jgi:DNA-binding LacI/PurR family transcriptional regulator
MMLLNSSVSQVPVLMIKGAVVAARQRGYDLMLLTPGSKDHRGIDAMISLAQRRVDALLVPFWRGRMVFRLQTQRWPMIFLSHPAENGYPGMLFNPEPGIRAAVAHLAELGHKRLLYLGWLRDGAEQCPERWLSYQRAAGEQGVAVHTRNIATGAIDDHADIAEQTALFRRALEHDLPRDLEASAILCYNDAMGLALYTVLARRGLRIPDDISVIGFDDWHAVHAVPAMTTVSQMMPERGEAGVDLAVQLLEEKQQYPCEINREIDAALVVRQSTGPVREA